jgi:HemY protein
MFRLLVYLLFVVALAFGLAWLIERPGEIVLNWQGYQVKTSLLVGLGAVLSAVAVLVLAWSFLSTAIRSPSVISAAARARRREKGFVALSQGIHAVAIGDAERAAKAAAQVQKYLPGEPVALLLRAEAAQLIGDHQAVEAVFREMAGRDDTRLLGYRGLHAHAHRRGEIESAHHYASAAHQIAALPWSAAAVLDQRVAAKDWQGALAALEDNRNLIDKITGERQRAVLIAALALEKEQMSPDESLRLARIANKRAPDLVPATALAARLLARRGAVRRAARLIKSAWPLGPHPDLAKLYLDLRPGESHNERLSRARVLAKLAPRDPESRMVLASAAIAACDFRAARDAMRPLIEDKRPTARMCLLMAEIEEAEHGESGYIREWLARASRAPRDACWIADGVMSDQWMPASPVSGKLGAFVWKRPDERIVTVSEPAEAVFRPIAAPSPASTILLEKRQTVAIPPAEPERPPALAAADSKSVSQPATEESTAAGDSGTAGGAKLSAWRSAKPSGTSARIRDEARRSASAVLSLLRRGREYWRALVGIAANRHLGL